MYRNPRSKGFKIKNILQVCFLLAVCFWLIFQVKRSRDKNKDFDVTRDDKLTTRIQSSEEIVKLGRKHLPVKVDETVKEQQQEVEDEVEEDNKHEEEEEEEVDEEKIDEEKDDEIDENDQQKSDLEIEREEVDIIDEDKETEEKEEESQNGSTLDIDEEHTHELREEHYKADDASSAVTHDGRLLRTENDVKNGTLDDPSENVGQENDTEPLDSSMNPASSIDFLENGPPSNTTVIEQVSNSAIETNVETEDVESENLETSDVIEGTEEALDPDEVQHLEEKEVRTDLDTLPEIETEAGNSEDTAEE